MLVVLGIDRPDGRVLDLPVHRLHQGRAADRARHVLVGERAAALDGEAGALGCSKSVVGLVVPTGYSFNLDGTNIYMTLATLFIAQALGVDLTFGQQMTILLVAMLTSKGASRRHRGGLHHAGGDVGGGRSGAVPGMAIVLGIDKFMSECRALTKRRRPGGVLADDSL